MVADFLSLTVKTNDLFGGLQYFYTLKSCKVVVWM